MQTVLNILFALLAAAGILTALFGIGIEFLPGAYPGLNLPQALLIVGGLLLSLAAFRLRRADARRRAWGTTRKHWLPGLVIAAMTLIALEFILTAAGVPAFFPPDIPEELLDPRPWQTCDRAGCHYVYDVIVALCVNETNKNPVIHARFCTVNRQGFHDTQDFAASDDLDGRTRILALGDSFTYGLEAEMGKSYVETIEANFPQSIVWNTGIIASGTHQALASFQVYAPILQPQLTILGFNVNDFGDNLLPIDERFWLGEKDGRIFIRRRQADGSEDAITPEHRRVYYNAHGVLPPASEIERLIGRTRLGSLLLRMIEVVQGKPPFDNWRRRVDVTRGYLRDLREAAAAQDTALLVLLIPHKDDIPRPAYQAALQLFEELELPYLNPIHALDVELDYLPDPGFHWNSAGHQKIGIMLSDCIEAFQVSGDLADCEQVKMP